MNPVEAFNKYDTAERTACNEYRDFWIAKFGAANITLVAEQWYGTLAGQFQNYRLAGHVSPSRFGGVKIEVHVSGSGRCHFVKVKSESGFVKLVRKLQLGVFQ